MMRIFVVAIAMLLSTPAVADSLGGHVIDKATSLPVEGALVMISGSAGLVTTVTTDRDGRYRAELAPGTYNVIFANDHSRTSARVAVAGATDLDGKLDAMTGEVIEVHGKLAKPVPPKPINYKPTAAPPYSDEAVLTDAWTRAHMLLEIDEHGVVQRYKFLQRPGYDLEAIAGREVAKLKFEPAKDEAGRPMRSWLVWTIEWPSAWWLERIMGTRSTMPGGKDHYIPCRGSGPWVSSAERFVPWYKDCSKPDLRKAAAAPWIDAR